MHQLNTDCAGRVMPDHKAGLCQQILFHSLALAFCTFSVIAVCAEPVECRGCLQESLPGRRVALLLRVPCGPGSFGTCQQKSRVQHRFCQLDGLQRTFLVMCTLHRVPGLCSAQRSASRPGPVGTSAPGAFLSLHSPETPQTPHLQGHGLAAGLSWKPWSSCLAACSFLSCPCWQAGAGSSSARVPMA